VSSSSIRNIIRSEEMRFGEERFAQQGKYISSLCIKY
jgi:hypothetical protein